jgi:hypothetical protein
MRAQEQALRDAIGKLKDRLEAETAKSKEFGGKLKVTLDQLQEECGAHDNTKVSQSSRTENVGAETFSLLHMLLPPLALLFS